MTENEAIDIIQDKIETCEFYFAENDLYPKWCEYEFLESLGAAISSLKEIQQYREIGTVEECRKAVEKQKGMQVNEIHVDEYFCPACGSENNCDYGKVHDKYCPICGHAIYQEESEEE